MLAQTRAAEGCSCCRLSCRYVDCLVIRGAPPLGNVMLVCPALPPPPGATAGKCTTCASARTAPAWRAWMGWPRAPSPPTPRLSKPGCPASTSISCRQAGRDALGVLPLASRVRLQASLCSSRCCVSPRGVGAASGWASNLAAEAGMALCRIKGSPFSMQKNMRATNASPH